jgi:hypothetical protein
MSIAQVSGSQDNQKSKKQSSDPHTEGEEQPDASKLILKHSVGEKNKPSVSQLGKNN